MKSILKRIELLEEEIGNNAIEEKDKIIVVVYPNGDEEAFERGLEKRMTELREKYGPNIKESDFLIIGLLRFAVKKTKEE